MFKRVLTPREKTIALIAAGLILIWLGRGIILEPMVSQENKLRTQTAERRKELREGMALLRKEHQTREQYQGILKNFTQVGSQEEEMSRLVLQLQTFANQSSLRVLETKPQTLQRKGDHNLLFVSLNLEGNLRDIVSFLHALQAPPQHLGVENLAIETKPAQSLSLICRIQISRILFPSLE